MNRRALPLLTTFALAVGAGCVPARIDAANGLSVVGLIQAATASPSPSPKVVEVDPFGRPIASRPPGADLDPSPVPPPTASPASGCDASVPTGVPVTGTAAQGAYAGKLLPSGWGVHASEGAVTAEIKKLEGGSAWPCFQKFYPEALAVYRSR